eukprot:m.204013 g.204013  ORF g.204013 m.204013 type:complete len:1066 (+) comp17742_c0_seq4:224-3421(+)
MDRGSRRESGKRSPSVAHNPSGMHVFTKKTFRRPTYCQHCGDLLWGLTGQGVFCDICNFACHERCVQQLSKPCLIGAAGSIQDPTTHQWLVQKVRKRVFCNVCRTGIDRDRALHCRGCGAWAHKQCHSSALDDCRPSAVLSVKADGSFVACDTRHSPETRHHWWREGNLPSKAICAVCQKSCYSSHCLYGLQCGWCFETVHAGCASQCQGVCNMGELASLILPPECVSMGCTVSRDPLDFGDADLDAEELKEAAAGAALLVKEGMVSIRVCQGVRQHPTGAFKMVDVQRNMTVSAVVEAALKAFGVHDGPESYVLSEVCYKAAPRASSLVPGAPVGWKCPACGYTNPIERLDCEWCETLNVEHLQKSELQSEDIEHSERISTRLQAQRPDRLYIFYLRANRYDKLMEEKKGVLRIYPGPELGAASSFKTVPASLTTTAAEIVQMMGRKFCLDDITGVFLQEVRFKDGTERRFKLQPTDCPLQLRARFNETCVNENLQRFYLREQSQTGEHPSSLFVRNLGTDKSEAEMVKYLADILECGAGYRISIPLVLPTKGCAVIRTRSPEEADIAISILKLTQVNDKPLEVTWLPVIEGLAPSDMPLLVFVNGKSGGGQGRELLCSLSAALNPNQVFDVTSLGPLPGFCAFRTALNFRVLVAGGDGTVGWVMSVFEEFRPYMLCKNPPISVLPVGTGNDLSRVLGWGPGYSGQAIESILERLANESDTVVVDRWSVVCSGGPGEPTRTESMTNYFGVGIDAAIALDFHEMREAHPERFTSRTRNKGHYVSAGMSSLVKQPCKDLKTVLVFEGDGKEVPLKDIQGIICLNVASFGAGADPWGGDRDDGFAAPSFGDGLLEVVGVYGVLHLSHISAHLRSGKRLGQFRNIRFTIQQELPVQIDGEPWRQKPCVITISHKGQVPMLRRSKPLKGRSGDDDRDRDRDRDRLRSEHERGGRDSHRSSAHVDPDSPTMQTMRERTGLLSGDSVKRPLGRRRSGSAPNLADMMRGEGESSTDDELITNLGLQNMSVGAQAREDDPVAPLRDKATARPTRSERRSQAEDVDQLPASEHC